MRHLLLLVVALAAGLTFGAPAGAQEHNQAPVQAKVVEAGQTESEIRREDIISKCRSWGRWYGRWSDIYAGLWHTATTGVIVLTALTSLLVALNFGETRKWAIVSISAVAGLLTTLSVQFRLKENWQLREVGRLEVLALEVEARSLRASDPDLRDKAFGIEKRLVAIDRAQAGLFFETLFKDGRGPGETPKPRT